MFSSRRLALFIASATWLVNAAPAPALDIAAHAAAVSACDMIQEMPDLSVAFAGMCIDEILPASRLTVVIRNASIQQ